MIYSHRQLPTILSTFLRKLNVAFSLKDLGDLHFFLGIEAHRHNNSLYLTQRKYVGEILERAKMTDANSISSPAALVRSYSRVVILWMMLLYIVVLLVHYNMQQ